MRRRRPRKPRPPGSTTARGWGSAHQKLAAALLAVWQPGDPCARCGRPMWQRWRMTRTGKVVTAIHLDHTDDRTAYLGLSHASCNESSGASEGNRARVTANGERAMDAAMTVRPSRAW